MHKSHEAVTKEIDDIVCHGITTSNLHTLGELVDIKKDVEECEVIEMYTLICSQVVQ